MAVTTIDKVEVGGINKISPAVTGAAASSATDGFKLQIEGKDNRTVFRVANSAASAGTLTIKAGTSQRAAQEDLVLTVPANKVCYFTLDSGYWEDVVTDKGYVKAIPSATTLTVEVVEI